MFSRSGVRRFSLGRLLLATALGQEIFFFLESSSYDRKAKESPGRPGFALMLSPVLAKPRLCRRQLLAWPRVARQHCLGSALEAEVKDAAPR